MKERLALLALNAVPGLGTRRIRNLVAAFQSAGNVFLQPKDRLSSVNGIGPSLARVISGFSWKAFLEEELERMAQQDIRYVTWIDNHYPLLLKHISDPPPVLYIKGRHDIWMNPCIAIVGSRRASLHGMTIARDLAYRLGERGICVVSGMARGIDTAAHQGSLEAGGPTIAVLGNGLEDPYPQDNQTLCQGIVAQGAVLSEFPLSARPLAAHFPRRNRIVSGLCWGVVVVEAAERSGALITAYLALEQGREVFAVPGLVGRKTSTGTHALIKQGACLVTSVDDIIDEFSDRLKEYYRVNQSDQCLLHE